MQDDRARLASELDGAMARVAQVESAAREVEQRLERAIGVVGAVVARAQGEQLHSEH